MEASTSLYAPAPSSTPLRRRLSLEGSREGLEMSGVGEDSASGKRMSLHSLPKNDFRRASTVEARIPLWPIEGLQAEPQHSARNPLFQVSSEMIRAVGGHGGQFRNLLSKRRDPKDEELGGSRAVVRTTQSLDTPATPTAPASPETPTVQVEGKQNGGVRSVTIAADTTAGSGAGPRIPGIARRTSGYSIRISSESSIKHRLKARKTLFHTRSKVCDYILVFALLGVGLAIVEAELTANEPRSPFRKTDWPSIVLRLGVVASTLVLLGLVVWYHSIEIRVSLIDSGADDWRVALTGERVRLMLTELLVCAVCPLPGTGSFEWPYLNPNHRSIRMVEVPVDVVLTVPMFLRSYLLARFMVLHSKQFQDAATRSIAALNRITVDFHFVMKTMMYDHPLRVLIVFTIAYWICMAWMLTQCERHHDGAPFEDNNYLNSLWLIIVTFMSIGYGDIVPNTYCGRAMAITTGVVGGGVSAGLVAVISRKLELSRAEKHVNNFMADSKLMRQRKNAAASVLQQTWFIHKHKAGKGGRDDFRVRAHQRKFLHAINEFRRVKWEQRKLNEQGNALVDIGKIHADLNDQLFDLQRSQEALLAGLDTLAGRVAELSAAVAYGAPRTAQRAPDAPEESEPSLYDPTFSPPSRSRHNSSRKSSNYSTYAQRMSLRRRPYLAPTRESYSHSAPHSAQASFDVPSTS